MSVRVFAPAKINLTLKVGKPRPDGLHPLQSVVMFGDVGDIVEAAPAERLSLTLEGEFADGLAAGEDNLVMRAGRLLARASGLHEPGAALLLEKNLPIASGLGGGSSDAAAALRALSALWKLDLRPDEMAKLALELGADVPVCLLQQTAYVTGAGETLTPMRAPQLAAILVNPIIPLPTANVYRQFDRMNLGAALSDLAAPNWPNIDTALTGMAALGNDLEPAARSLLPELDKMATMMRDDNRISHAGLSGSGATMFALVQSESVAAELAEQWQRAHPEWWITDTILGAT